MTPSHVMQAHLRCKEDAVWHEQQQFEAKKAVSYHRSRRCFDRAIFWKSEDPLLEDIPLPSVADPDDENLLRA